MASVRRVRAAPVKKLSSPARVSPPKPSATHTLTPHARAPRARPQGFQCLIACGFFPACSPTLVAASSTARLHALTRRRVHSEIHETLEFRVQLHEIEEEEIMFSTSTARLRVKLLIYDGLTVYYGHTYRR